MKANLAPKYIQSAIDFKILWFEKSNQYTIIDNGLFFCIETYIESDNPDECIALYQATFDLTKADAKAIYLDITEFLNDRNTLITQTTGPILKLNYNNRIYSKQYAIGKTSFNVHYQSEELINFIHPQIHHLETTTENKPDFWFDIQVKDNVISLFTNNKFIRSCDSYNFHELQGKFNMELICGLHHKKEHDWIGLFHASTVSNGKNSVMLIGTSGSGKSTLTTVLTQNGYDLIADDTTPILRADFNTYYFPGGISVKPGAFSTLKPFISNFENLPESYLRAHKGGIKYVATPIPHQKHVPCNTIVLINYQTEAKVLLEKIDAKTALEILIPDSWISPQTENAAAFLNWISTVKFLKLTYSKNEDALEVFSTIFIGE
ncbi:hypothetical protein FNB79_06640 [Formosa sediminum]|uniref:Uncharacterized protein n=1 Tax=Formosa sediminum TaxID=2594004 RepID=A0A516GQ60_9FLAO|nr:hypothetical protein [Formosa sediminum]QDO93664.1 hypothetical protein FNB79_06640 [Formosa sediminum]